MIPDGYTDLSPGKIASVVTYLEMLTRPALEEAGSSGVCLRKIENPGLEWYRALYRRAGAQWLWFSRLELTDEQLTKLLNRPTAEMFIAESAGLDLGKNANDEGVPVL